MTNYYPDVNRFKLAGPPVWFQKQLWDFDPSLVIVPSKQGFYYRLSQRRPLLLSAKIVNDVLKEQADTQMLARYGLVPVTTILATCNWSNPLLFVELQRRAPWRMGGAEKFSAMIDGQERQELIDKNIQQDEHLSYLAKDAWKFYQQRTGLRSHLWSPTTKHQPSSVSSAPKRSPKSSYRPDVMSTWLNR